MCNDQNGMNDISITVILSKIYHERKEKSYKKVIVDYSLIFFRLCLPIDISQHVHVNYVRIKHKIILRNIQNISHYSYYKRQTHSCRIVYFKIVNN